MMGLDQHSTCINVPDLTGRHWVSSTLKTDWVRGWLKYLVQIRMKAHEEIHDTDTQMSATVVPLDKDKALVIWAQAQFVDFASATMQACVLTQCTRTETGAVSTGSCPVSVLCGGHTIVVSAWCYPCAKYKITELAEMLLQLHCRKAEEKKPNPWPNKVSNKNLSLK